MSYELTGTVKKIMDLMTFNSGFTKREFVVTTEDKFPQDIKISCLKEKTDLLNNLSEGERVKVHFDIRGNEYKERFYVDLVTWKIEQLDGSDAGDAPPPAQLNEEYAPAEDEDFPF